MIEILTSVVVIAGSLLLLQAVGSRIAPGSKRFWAISAAGFAAVANIALVLSFVIARGYSDREGMRIIGNGSMIYVFFALLSLGSFVRSWSNKENSRWAIASVPLAMWPLLMLLALPMAHRWTE